MRLALLVAAAARAAGAVPAVVGWRVPQGLSYEELLAAYALQGVANQDGPRVSDPAWLPRRASRGLVLGTRR